MFLLLDERDVILTMSKMCKKCSYGWQISEHAIYASNDATMVEVDEVPEYVIPEKYRYKDGVFKAVEGYVEPVNVTKQLTENLDALSEEIKNVKTEVYKTDPNDMTTEEFRSYLRDLNNTKFAEFLRDNPILWSDGKHYGVSEEDQSLMLKNYQGWTLLKAAGADVNLEWNAANEGCHKFTEEEYVQLMGAIYVYAKKMLKLCQYYKMQIISATNRIDLNSIDLNYSLELAEKVINLQSK